MVDGRSSGSTDPSLAADGEWDQAPDASASSRASGPGPGATPNRRQVLKAATGLPIAAGLAGCQALETDRETGIGTPVSDLDPGDVTGFHAAVRFGDRYELTVRRPGSAGPDPAVTGRFHGADHYLRLTQDGTVVESYLVAGDGYVVRDGNCTRYPELGRGLETVEGTTDEVEAAASEVDLEVVGPTEIDGHETLEMVAKAGAFAGVESPVTYFVDAETRYPRRVELPETVIEYRRWGAVEPIDPPGMACQDAE